MKPEAAFPFFAAWIGLGAAVWLFHWRARVETKQRWHPWIIATTAGMFVAFVTLVAPVGLFLAVPSVLVISFLNWRFTKFCSRCGRTLVQNPPWVPMNFCPRCGADMRRAMPPNKELQLTKRVSLENVGGTALRPRAKSHAFSGRSCRPRGWCWALQVNSRLGGQGMATFEIREATESDAEALRHGRRRGERGPDFRHCGGRS